MLYFFITSKKQVLNQILKEQMQGNCCPICSKAYNQRSRKEMIICLKQHFVCLNCADEISQKDSLCPFCRKKFDITEIEPRRIFSEQQKVSPQIHSQKQQDLQGSQNLCPSGHQKVKYSQEYGLCQKCKGKTFIGGIQCKACFYRECSKCLDGKSFHTKCDNKYLEFGEGEGYVAYPDDPTKRLVYGLTCNVCQKFTKKYVHCKRCNLYACPACRLFALKN